MKPRPEIYANVLILGGGSPPGDAVSGRIGGVWVQPNLGLSYLLAARHVLEAGERERRLNEVVLPAAYLQRHAFEIMLKDTIDAAYAVRQDLDWLEQLQKDAAAKPARPKRAPAVHPLNDLVSELREALVALEFPVVPDDVVTMAQRLTTTEAGDPTRTRYLTRKDGKPNFPDALVLPVGETQDALEALFAQVFAYQGTEGEDWNLVTSLANEGEATTQAILGIVPLSEF